MNIPFDNSYARLPERFFSRVVPAQSPAPAYILTNDDLAIELGIDAAWLSSADGLAVLSGQSIAEGSEPIATAYAGHQFGNFVPQLGDGRAVLLGEVIDRHGRRRDIQLKGGGRTPYSRGGDGRAALGPILREYLVSEAMAALGIPTTRALAALTTGEDVYRDGPLPGAVLARVASSHIRVGTFQYFASRGDVDGVRALADHVIVRHYPDAARGARPYRALLDRVIEGQADLIARWMLVGFIHGVMNTDNMSVACETIDYGPCAFLDAYHPETVYSSIDRAGRYAFGNQPRIGLWDLTRLAETLIPLLDNDEAIAIEQAQEALSAFAPRFQNAHLQGLCSKLGLSDVQDDDADFVAGVLATLADNQVDFTLFFRHLANAIEATNVAPVRDLFVDPTAADALLAQWRERLSRDRRSPDEQREAMRRINPAYIPRNHRIEEAIQAAARENDFRPFKRLLSVLSRPFDDQPDHVELAAPPLEHEVVQATFCGT